MAALTKQQKRSNFASAGRVLGTGEVKPAPDVKKTKVDDNGDEDYVPDLNTSSVSVTVEHGNPTGKKRKRSSEDTKEAETTDEAFVRIVKLSSRRGLRFSNSSNAFEDARARLAERYKRESAEGENDQVAKAHGEAAVDQSPGEMVEKSETKDVAEGALRGGRNRDAFVNKYGKGHHL